MSLGLTSGIGAYLVTRSDKMKPISMFQRPDPLPKYFAIDVDGTFYTSNEDSFKKNVEAFKLLKDKNITPFFCTGRSTKSTINLLGEEFINQTGYNGYPGVYTNGSLVYDSDGNLIKIEKFSEDFLNKFVTFMVDNDIHNKTLFVTDDSAYFLYPLSQKIIEYITLQRITLPEIITLDELKTKNVVIIGFPNLHFEIDGLTKGIDYQFKIANKIFATITPGNCTKKKGLEFLLKHLNADGSNCTYIGDEENDIEAMEYCTESFAVGDADDETKQKAKWVLDLKHDEGAFGTLVNSLYYPL